MEKYLLDFVLPTAFKTFNELVINYQIQTNKKILKLESENIQAYRGSSVSINT